MAKQDYIYIETGGKAGIKAFTRGVPVAENAWQQLGRTSRLPFVEHLAAMPDVHWGRGSTVGSVIGTAGAVVPAAVGVDIGCGMCATKLNLTADELPDNLFDIRSAIEAAVPHGRTDNGGRNDRGAWGNVPRTVDSVWADKLCRRYQDIIAKHPGAKWGGNKEYSSHLGTLGTGNHFVEVCLDTENNVWVMLHSGSRGIGNRIGTYFIEKAKEEMRRYHVGTYLEDQDLSYLVEHTELFDDYIEAVMWAQDYAKINREIMMANTIRAMEKVLKRPLAHKAFAVNCHHNYVEKENHFGKNLWVTRKGAVRAREDDLGIIPGSMGAKSFIVRGLGNPHSMHSCSHGAGRVMSRGDAKRQITLDQHLKDTEGVECRKDKGVLDESPRAYKNIDDVMAAQSSLVEIEATLKQVVCVKG